MKTNKAWVILLTSAFGVATAGTMGSVGLGNTQGPYISGFVNYNFLNYDSAETASFSSPARISAPASSIQDKIGYTLGAGYRFNPRFRASFLFDNINHIGFSVSDDGGETAKGHINIYNYMAAAYFSPFLISDRIEPYIMGGIGAATTRTSNIFWPLANQIEFGKSTTQFAWQVGLGSIYRLTEHFDLDLNYNFISFGDVTNTGNYNAVGSNGVPPAGAPTRLNHLYSNQLAVGMHYRFG